MHSGGQGGLNFTRFACSRKGGGNAMGKGGGSGEREWGILTVTYKQQAEQSRADRALPTVSLSRSSLGCGQDSMQQGCPVGPSW